MSTSSSTREIHPGCSYSISELLRLTKGNYSIVCPVGGATTKPSSRHVKVLKHDSCRTATTMDQAEVERDALEVLGLIRFAKNSFAPINRIPPEVLSLIPDCNDSTHAADRELIRLTHVCRGWRDTFISRSSLWTKLDFPSVEKTRMYIQRSKSSPLKVCFENEGGNIDETFFLDPTYSPNQIANRLWGRSSPRCCALRRGPLVLA